MGLACKAAGGPAGCAHGELPIEHQGPPPAPAPSKSMAWAPGAAGPEQSFCADLGENSLRILEADYQRYVILHMQSSRRRDGLTSAGALRYCGPSPGRVRGWPGHPQSSPWHVVGRAPSSRCPTPAPPSPSPPLPTGPKLLSTGRFPELKSSFLDRFDKPANHTDLAQKRSSASVTRVASGPPTPAAWASKALKGHGGGDGSPGPGWGRDSGSPCLRA